MTAIWPVLIISWRVGWPFAHLTDGFKLSSDPLFLEKVVDVVGLYHDPPEKAVVLCVDEQSRAPRGADGTVREEGPAAGRRSDRSKLEAG